MRISDWSSDVCSSDLHGSVRSDLRALSTSDLPSGAHAYSLLSPNGLDGTSPGTSAPTSVASPTAVACAAGRSATNTRFMRPSPHVSRSEERPVGNEFVVQILSRVPPESYKKKQHYP